MTSPPALPSRPSGRSPLGTENWSLTLNGAIGGLALARERGWLLVRVDQQWLYLLDARGQRQAQFRSGAGLTTAVASDDGSAYAAGAVNGEVSWLAPDLMSRWQRAVHHRITGIALDAFGQYLAVSDASGGLALFTREGRQRWQISCPRPLVHLAFVPESAHLIGCADYGLVMCLDFEGQTVWRDGVVAHIGALAVSGDGSSIQLACFSDGLYRYGLRQPRPDRIGTPEPARLVAMSDDGRSLAAVNLSKRLMILNRDGSLQAERQFDASVTAVALGPFGDLAFVGLANGTLTSLRGRQG